MSHQELESAYSAVMEEFEACKSRKLSLNIARGKPSKAQLDLVSGVLTVLSEPQDCISDGIDARNYGELSGLPCAKAFWADILGC